VRLFISVIMLIILSLMVSCKLPKSFDCENKTISLYSCDGKIIQQWENVRYEGNNGGIAIFKDNQGKYQRISGIFIISQQ
jgi:hypothetical protein